MLTNHRPTQTCQVCGARVSHLRRGRCSVCYLRWTQNRPVGRGAYCVVCGERRHDHLHMVEFQQRWLPMCFSCSGRGLRLHPLPETIADLRYQLERNRRDSERRNESPDRRIFQIERRACERRIEAGEDGDWIDASDLVVEMLDGRLDDGRLDDGSFDGGATRIVDPYLSKDDYAADSEG